MERVEFVVGEWRLWLLVGAEASAVGSLWDNCLPKTRRSHMLGGVGGFWEHRPSDPSGKIAFPEVDVAICSSLVVVVVVVGGCWWWNIGLTDPSGTIAFPEVEVAICPFERPFSLWGIFCGGSGPFYRRGF